MRKYPVCKCSYCVGSLLMYVLLQTRSGTSCGEYNIVYGGCNPKYSHTAGNYKLELGDEAELQLGQWYLFLQ